ncbi:hypothetical protein HAX54_037667, partial [Datura stramonium]|nr:hypothetical protein [Datura stramonium]
MTTTYIYIALNGKWNAKYKYVDHETKLYLVKDGINFREFRQQILDSTIEANIWFDTNEKKSKGMHITNDDELNTFIHSLKNNSRSKNFRFILDYITNE